MTNVEMCDTLDKAIEKICLLSEIFQAGDVDTNNCQNGLLQVVEGIYQNVSDVYDSINMRRIEEAEAIARRSEEGGKDGE